MLVCFFSHLQEFLVYAGVREQSQLYRDFTRVLALFVPPPQQIEEENAALLAALTDSLDGMVDAEVGGLSVFPALGEEPDREDEEEDGLPLGAEDFSQPLGAETEDPSLVRAPLYRPGSSSFVVTEITRGEKLLIRALISTSPGVVVVGGVSHLTFATHICTFTPSLRI